MVLSLIGRHSISGQQFLPQKMTTKGQIVLHNPKSIWYLLLMSQAKIFRVGFISIYFVNFSLECVVLWVLVVNQAKPLFQTHLRFN